MVLVHLFLVAILILATAFFVVSEFAIVKVRHSRIHQLVEEGDKRAVNLQKIVGNLDEYLSACQLGITITALGLGWLGEPTFEALFQPLLVYLNLPSHLTVLFSFIAAFSTVTFLHVVLGELAPKTVAIQKAEAVSLAIAKPLIIFYSIAYLAIHLLNVSANFFVRIFGLHTITEQDEAHSEEELRIIISESYRSGKINQVEYGYVDRIFTFDDLLAREIMVPRTDMVCLYAERSLEENLEIIKKEQYTRFPVVKGSKDNIIGVVNTKAFFLHYLDNQSFDLSALIHPVLSVYEATPIKDLLKKIQQHGVPLAILVDEYGGTSGIVTVEDIIEEIVGDIKDEFDTEEKAEIERQEDKSFLVDGKVLVSEINTLFHLEIEREGFDTVGGWLYSQNPLLKEGDRWQEKDLIFTIMKKDRNRIRKVRVSRNKPMLQESKNEQENKE